MRLSLSLSQLSSLTLSAAQQVNEVEGDDGKELDKGEYGSTCGFNNKKKKREKNKKTRKVEEEKKRGKEKLNLKKKENEKKIKNKKKNKK